MKILLVDDDKDTVDVTTYALRKYGYQVVSDVDGPRGLKRWEQESPDLVILDVGLPKLNGFEVCRKIRAASRTPVILLTGRTDEESVVRGFLAGADDYVPKPFSHRQLAMRVRAVLGRCADQVPAEPGGELRTADMRLDLESHEVVRQDRTVRLSPLEFRILHLLAANEGRVVSSERLAEYAWSYEGGPISQLKFHICHIRQKLHLEAAGTPNIESVPWVGYKLTRAAATEPSRAA